MMSGSPCAKASQLQSRTAKDKTGCSVWWCGGVVMADVCDPRSWEAEAVGKRSLHTLERDRGGEDPYKSKR